MRQPTLGERGLFVKTPSRTVTRTLSVNLCVCVSERLARQREILEERAERRLEIFKNLVNNLSVAGAAAAAAAAAAAPVCWNKL